MRSHTPALHFYILQVVFLCSLFLSSSAMSSQSEGINVRHNPSSSGYRLIELPSEVETALEGPGAPLLTLASAEDGSMVLRTPDKSYNVRQKNTSNTLFLMSPQTCSADEPKQAVETIAMIHETVELEEVVNKEAVSRKLNSGSKGKWHEKFGKNR